jgi:hypothetical protein
MLDQLSRVILKWLELDACVEKIITRLESDAGNSRLDQIKIRQQIAGLEKEISKWKKCPHFHYKGDYVFDARNLEAAANTIPIINTTVI